VRKIWARPESLEWACVGLLQLIDSLVLLSKKKKFSLFKKRVVLFASHREASHR
jgi:hypothetical protein